MPDDSPYLLPEDAAAFLHVTESWLAKSRCSGFGPAYHKVGRRVLYTRQDLVRFVEATRRTCTSDQGSTRL
jgi:hypothetical protein